MLWAATLTRKPKNKNEPHQLFNPSAHWIKHYSIFPREFICMSHQLSHTFSVSDAEAQTPVKPLPFPPSALPWTHPATSLPPCSTRLSLITSQWMTGLKMEWGEECLWTFLGATLPVVVCLEEIAVEGWVPEKVQDSTTIHFQPLHRLIWVYYILARRLAPPASRANQRQTALSGCKMLWFIPAVQANSILFPCISVLSGTIHFTAWIKVCCIRLSSVNGGVKGGQGE